MAVPSQKTPSHPPPSPSDSDEEWDPLTAPALAQRLASLIGPCARLRTVARGSREWQDAADFLLILSQADLHLLTADLVVEVGPNALDVSDALVGIIRAAVHPRCGSPTLRETAYKFLVAWARELRHPEGR